MPPRRPTKTQGWPNVAPRLPESSTRHRTAQDGANMSPSEARTTIHRHCLLKMSNGDRLRIRSISRLVQATSEVSQALRARAPRKDHALGRHDGGTCRRQLGTLSSVDRTRANCSVGPGRLRAQADPTLAGELFRQLDDLADRLVEIVFVPRAFGR